MNKLRTWVNEHEHLAGILCLVIIVGLAYAAGRFAAPDKVKTVTLVQKATHDQVTQVATKTDTHEQAQKTSKTQTKIVYRDRIVHADGSTEEKSVEENVDQATQLNVDLHAAAQVAAQTVIHDTVATTMKEKEVDRERPAWTVGLVGSLLIDEHGLRPFGGLMGGHRVVGPMWLDGAVQYSPASATSPKPALLVSVAAKATF